VSRQSGSTVSGPTVGISTSPVPLFDKASALFMGAENGSAWGRPQAKATFYLIQKDKTVTLLYPGRQTADSSVVNLLKSLKSKDPVYISAENYLSKECLTSISQVTQRAGEEKPCVFVFGGVKEAKSGAKGVTLSKLFRTQTLPLAKAASDAAAMPDKLQNGDLVYAEVDLEDGRQVLTLVEPYHPPLKGELIKFNPPKPGQDSASVEVQTESGQQTFTLPTRTVGTRQVVSPKLRAAVEKLKPGQAVELHVDHTNDKTLIAIWPAREDKKPQAALGMKAK